MCSGPAAWTPAGFCGACGFTGCHTGHKLIARMHKYVGCAGGRIYCFLYSWRSLSWRAPASTWLAALRTSTAAPRCAAWKPTLLLWRGFNPCCVHRRRGNSASLHKSAPRCAAYGGCWRAACPCTLAGSGLSEVCCRLMRLSWRPPAALRPSQISRPDSSSPGVFRGVHRPGFALLQRQLKGAQRQRGARQQRKRTITMGMLLGWVLQLLRGWSGRVQCVVLACVLGVFGMLRRSNLVPGSRRCLWAGSTCGVVLLCWSPATCSLPHSP